MSFVCQIWGSAKRAFLGSSVLVLLGLIVFLTSIVAMNNHTVAFEEFATNSGVVSKVEYYLPYPGLLPDSPVYKLKAARDITILWLTFNSEKKADKERLYADKRIGAAKALFEGGKRDLAVITAGKAEKYLVSAFEKLEKLAKEKQDVKSQLLTMRGQIIKHEEILEEFLSMSSGTNRNAVEESLKMNKLLQQRLNQTWEEIK